jgi:BirA family biotin operon repressor/biotin-[acetyl-CoA-carboxylase] ligase
LSVRDKEAFTVYLEEQIPGFHLARRYPSVSSTMDVARQLIEELPAGRGDFRGVIVADEQTAGRGRQGRSWLSGAGAFMATFILSSRAPLAALSGYSLCVGLGVAWALEAIGVKIKLKWPNDLVFAALSGEIRKLGGILIEVHEVGPERYILVGLGINVNPAPEGVRDIAISLSELGVLGCKASELTEPLACSISKAHDIFVASGGFAGIKSDWSSRSCFTENKTELALDLGDGKVISGTYMGVADSGALLLTHDGKVQSVVSGHILSVTLNQ